VPRKRAIQRSYMDVEQVSRTAVDIPEGSDDALHGAAWRVQRISGEPEPHLPLLESRLAKPFRHKTGLKRFLPALLNAGGSEVVPVSWHGSSDIAALARANAFLVADADRESWEAGDLIRVLLK
jgi:molybdopterin biosynthesis enzyme